jgi:hypothetical protein
VIDSIWNCPLKAYEIILPITISTKVEGWLMEAWQRENDNIGLNDVFQRMPTGSVTGAQLERHRLSRRKHLFRKEARLLSFEHKTYDSLWDTLLDEVNAHPEWVLANATRCLTDLTPEER